MNSIRHLNAVVTPEILQCVCGLLVSAFFSAKSTILKWNSKTGCLILLVCSLLLTAAQNVLHDLCNGFKWRVGKGFNWPKPLAVYSREIFIEGSTLMYKLHYVNRNCLPALTKLFPGHGNVMNHCVAGSKAINKTVRLWVCCGQLFKKVKT